MAGNWGLVDLDTPHSAYTLPSFYDGSSWQLVFSDEFNTDGRTFYPGDDPYWEAVDLHYWQEIIIFSSNLFILTTSHIRPVIWSGTTLQLSPPRMVLFKSHSLPILSTI